jgi:uncharacterized membrane protein YoaT (DUF817 family)
LGGKSREIINKMMAIGAMVGASIATYLVVVVFVNMRYNYRAYKVYYSRDEEERHKPPVFSWVEMFLSYLTIAELGTFIGYWGYTYNKASSSLDPSI